MSKIVYITSLLLVSIILQAQHDPQFAQFEGKLMRIPFKKMKFGPTYSEDALAYDSIGFISWPRIHVPNRDIDQGFPDVKRTQGFCMLLNSIMTVAEDACYDFLLESDDGSILWIDGKKIIENDRTQAMTQKRDTFMLRAGTYPIQLCMLKCIRTAMVLYLMPSIISPIVQICLIHFMIPLADSSILNQVFYSIMILQC